MDITPGTKVIVTTVFGQRLERRATTGIEPGDKFEIVRVCSEDEWKAAVGEHRSPIATAWPAEDVEVVPT